MLASDAIATKEMEGRDIPSDFRLTDYPCRA
jgi:hypothetical protein